MLKKFIVPYELEMMTYLSLKSLALEGYSSSNDCTEAENINVTHLEVQTVML